MPHLLVPSESHLKKTSPGTEDEIWKAGNAYQSKIYALHNRQDVPLMRKCKYTGKGKAKQSPRQRCRETQPLSTQFVRAAGREGQGIVLKNHCLGKVPQSQAKHFYLLILREGCESQKTPGFFAF